MRMSTQDVIDMLRQPRDNDTLGGRIWRARDALGVSAKQLATMTGVRPETVLAWEKDRSEPRPASLRKLADVLNVAPAWLVAGNGEAPDDGLSLPLSAGLRHQLSKIKALHEQTQKAISALEMDLERVIQDLQQDEM